MIMKSILRENISQSMYNRFITTVKLTNTVNNSTNLVIPSKIVEDSKCIYLISQKYLNIFEFMNLSHIHSWFKETGYYSFIMCIISGIKMLHSMNCYHGRLRFSNILLREEEEKYAYCLIDCCMSMLDAEKSEYTLETIRYASPEEINYNSIDKYTDIWHIGIILYIILTGKYPFNGNSIAEIKDKILSGNFTIYDGDFSDEYNRLFKRLFNINENERCNILEFESEIEKIIKIHFERGLEQYANGNFNIVYINIYN